MEILTMISSAQIPQTLAGKGTAEEAGGTQGKPGESSFFGLLFAQKGAADGKEASQILSQLMANLDSDAAPAVATPPGNAFGRLPGQTPGTEAPFGGTGIKMLLGTAPGLMVAESLGKPEGPGLSGLQTLPQSPDLAGLAAETPALQESGQSADSSRPEETDEASGKKGEKAADWVSLFTGVIPFLVGNPAKPEMQTADMVSSPKADAEPAGTADVSLTLPGNQIQQADTAAGEITPAGVAATLPGEADTAAGPGTSGTALTKVAPSVEAVLAEAAPFAEHKVSAGKEPVKTGEKISLSQTEKQDIPVAGAKGKGAESGQGDGTDTRVAGMKVVQAETSMPAGSRRIGEVAGNAYKAALGQTGRGNADNPEISDNAIQAKLPANGTETTNAGTSPERVEIVFAAKLEATRDEAGEAPSRKTQEVRANDGATTIGVTPETAQPRGAGEVRNSTQTSGERIPTAEQIVNQVKEKLEASGHAADNGRITLRLHPEELGELKINMRLNDHNLKVEIVTQNPTVKEALMQNLDTLKETLSRQNIAMERFDVSADLRQGFTQGGREERQMAQDNRGMDNGYPYAAADAEEELVPAPNYSWENENSLVNVRL